MYMFDVARSLEFYSLCKSGMNYMGEYGETDCSWLRFVVVVPRDAGYVYL